MRLDLVRFALLPRATLGVLYLDGEPRWFTLEDPDRLVVGLQKLPRETAIPTGRYALRRKAWSPRFKQSLLEVEGVPGFSDILIHVGNFPKDTQGCILVGQTVSCDPPFIGASASAIKALHDLVFPVIEISPVPLTIEHAPSALTRLEAMFALWSRESGEATA